ncbi:MAG TPA: TlpA disulfide reductase family protein [Candidatus Binatia bacterium]
MTSDDDGAGNFGPLVLEDLSGRRASLASLRGKVVLLNFWATWCQPCVAELPVLADLARRYHERGLVVVAASLDDKSARAAVERVAGSMPEGVQVWIGATNDDMQRLHLGAAVPVTVLIDRNGGVRARERGTLAQGQLDEKVESALGQASPHNRFEGATQARLRGPKDARPAPAGTPCAARLIAVAAPGA